MATDKKIIESIYGLRKRERGRKQQSVEHNAMKEPSTTDHIKKRYGIRQQKY